MLYFNPMENPRCCRSIVFLLLVFHCLSVACVVVKRGDCVEYE